MFAIMRSDKCKLSDVGGIEKEVNRSPDHPIPLIGSDIDWSKTKDNEYLIHSGSFRQSIKDVLAEYGITKYRKDAVVIIDSVWGFSPEFAEKEDPETIRNYFNDCLQFANKYLGVPINARIHVDEKTIHMHTEHIPIIRNDDGTFSLSAKRIMGNKADYGKRQDLFFEEVGEKYGFERCVKQDDRIEKLYHMNSIEFKTKMRAMELESLTNEVEAKTELLEKKEAEIQIINNKLDIVNADLDRKTTILETAFDRIESACKTFLLHVDQIYKSLSERIQIFIDKVFDKRILSADDFIDAHISAEELPSFAEGSNPLLLPVTNLGERLTWDGISPIYEQYEHGELVPYGSLDNVSGIIESENLFNWGERFATDDLDTFTDPPEKDLHDSLMDLQDLKADIAEVLGKKPDIDHTEEAFLPEGNTTADDEGDTKEDIDISETD